MTQLSRNSLTQEVNTPAPQLPVPLSFERNWLHDLESRLEKGGPWGDLRLSRLAVQGEESGLVTSFDELQCLKHLSGLSPLPTSLIPLIRYSLKCRAGRFSPTKSDSAKRSKPVSCLRNIWYADW